MRRSGPRGCLTLGQAYIAQRAAAAWHCPSLETLHGAKLHESLVAVAGARGVQELRSQCGNVARQRALGPVTAQRAQAAHHANHVAVHCGCVLPKGDGGHCCGGVGTDA